MTRAAPSTIPILDLAPEIDALRVELDAAIARVLDSGQFIMGPEVEAFEREAAEYLGVEHAVGVNSGTDALVIGLRALGIGPGDEVITTPFTFFATAESISMVGARPVFVDVDPDTFNLDPAKIEASITPATRAIMPVHLYGNPCDMDTIGAIAAEHELRIVEDCAQSFGAVYRRRMTGTIGDVGAFSFFPSKNLGAFGDGGLVATNDAALAREASRLRTHGSTVKYRNEVLGYNSRLDSIQAAILRVKLPHVDGWNERRRAIARRYDELLAGVSGVGTPRISDGHVFHQYTVRITSADRDRVQARLRERGIGTMVYYPTPQDRLPIYEGEFPRNPVSDRLATQVLSLPIWPSMPSEAQERVVDELAAALH